VASNIVASTPERHHGNLKEDRPFEQARKVAETSTSDARRDEMNGLCVAQVQPTKKQGRWTAAV